MSQQPFGREKSLKILIAIKLSARIIQLKFLSWMHGYSLTSVKLSFLVTFNVKVVQNVDVIWQPF